MIERSELDSGLRVVTESVPDLPSITIGAWVGSGSRDERVDAGEWGCSHFLEHLLFKGTAERSAREIADAIESVGGEMNAFTTHEQTVFYVRVPDVHFDLAFDVLADVVWYPAFRPNEVESERNVILEEIGMRDDTPDDLVHDVFGAAMFPGHPLGREVIGSRDSISAMTRDRIADYHAAHYHPSNVVLSVAGNVTHAAVLEAVAAKYPNGDERRPERRDPAPDQPAGRTVVERDLEQAHVVIGMRGLSSLDPDRYALTVVNQVLGGGMSSRLFQEVREQRGLAYSVYSYQAGFTDNGYVAVYAGTAPERVGESLDVINAELDKLGRDGVTDTELTAAKGHLTGSLAMSLETSASRMRRIGRAESVEHAVPSLAELLGRIEAVDHDATARVIERVFRTDARTLALVGPALPELA
ncbi:MAG TPA: pitrilysin family protein [Acidimicrobiia bacterium]|nr:pitrilysin family protein [Acidimicrobiia bacterium]